MAKLAVEIESPSSWTTGTNERNRNEGGFRDRAQINYIHTVYSSLNRPLPIRNKPIQQPNIHQPLRRTAHYHIVHSHYVISHRSQIFTLQKITKGSFVFIRKATASFENRSIFTHAWTSLGYFWHLGRQKIPESLYIWINRRAQNRKNYEYEHYVLLNTRTQPSQEAPAPGKTTERPAPETR